MKLWHLLFHNLLNMDDSLSWFISLFGLVITVRGIIAPFSWKSFKYGRMAAKIRPIRAALEEEYKDKYDEESIREFQDKQKQLNKEYGVNPMAGCMPALIQFPFFLGLYQVLLRMARPEGGLENPKEVPIGFLSPDEVKSFLLTRVSDVPLPAYVRMSDDQFTFLQTTQQAVIDYIVPFLVLTTVFTAVNMAVSVFRTFQTIDYSSGISLGIIKFYVPVAIVIPFFPLWMSFTGPFPVAIVLYWFANNLWTTAQTIIMHCALNWIHPLDEDFKEHSKQTRQAYKEKRKEKTEFKKSLRRNRLGMLIRPTHSAELHQENLRIKAARKSDLAAKKAELKDKQQKRGEVLREINRKRTEERTQQVVQKVADYKQRKAKKQPKHRKK